MRPRMYRNLVTLYVMIWTLLAFVVFSGTPQALEIGTVTLPDTLSIEAQHLILNGAEYRKKYMLKIYACGLYLTEKQTDPKSIIMADEPMAVRMHFVFKVPRQSMIEMMDKGFTNSTNGNIEPVRQNIEALYAQLPEILHKGDIVDLVYVKGKGIVCHINGRYKGESPGLDFKRAVFGIWLCDKPIAEYLKNGMLGK